MSEQISDRTGLPGLVARLKEFVPAKFRRGAGSGWTSDRDAAALFDFIGQPGAARPSRR